MGVFPRGGNRRGLHSIFLCGTGDTLPRQRRRGSLCRRRVSCAATGRGRRAACGNIGHGIGLGDYRGGGGLSVCTYRLGHLFVDRGDHHVDGGLGVVGDHTIGHGRSRRDRDRNRRASLRDHLGGRHRRPQRRFPRRAFATGTHRRLDPNRCRISTGVLRVHRV